MKEETTIREIVKGKQPTWGSSVLAEVKQDLIDKEGDSVDRKGPESHREASSHENLASFLPVAVESALDEAGVVPTVDRLHPTLDHIKGENREPAESSSEPAKHKLSQLRGFGSAATAEL